MSNGGLATIYPAGIPGPELALREHQAVLSKVSQMISEGVPGAGYIDPQGRIHLDQPAPIPSRKESDGWEDILNAVVSTVVDIVAPGAGSLLVSPLLNLAEGKDVSWGSLLSGGVTAIGAELGVPPVLTQELIGVGKIAAGDTAGGTRALIKGGLQEVGSMGLLDDLTTLANEGLQTLENVPVIGGLVSGLSNPALSLINSFTDPLANLIGLSNSQQQGQRVTTALPYLSGAESPGTPNSPGTTPPTGAGAPVGSQLGPYIPQGPSLPGAPSMGAIQTGMVQDARGHMRYGFFKTVATRGTRTFRVRPVGVNAQGQMVFKAVRHMNPLNIRAARRALHRVSSLERVVKRIVHFTHPRRVPKVHAFPFRHRRRKK